MVLEKWYWRKSPPRQTLYAAPYIVDTGWVHPPRFIRMLGSVRSRIIAMAGILLKG